MKQQAFEDRYTPEWDALDLWLTERAKSKPAPTIPQNEIPQRYRRLCHQLSLARDRRYGTRVVERLHRLASEIHQVLYGAQGEQRSRWLEYFYGGFARNVRAEWRVVTVAAVLFWLPLIVTFIVVQATPDTALYVLPAEQISQFDAMYGKQAERLGRREAESDFVMFGHYIFNNVRIDFQMFAGGMLLGVGTLFFLLFNGLVIGTVAGYATGMGYTTAFFSFVSGHSALELTAAVFAGAAGLMLGGAIVAPGRLTRKQALVAAGRRAAGIMYGTAAMTVAAAFVEAFWSPRVTVAPEIKYGVGIAAWVLVIAYFVFAGRSRGA